MRSISVKKAALGMAVLAGMWGVGRSDAGSLDPSGPPGPTMKTLDQIEARTAITNVPYTVTLPGSYYLVTNLSAGSGETGITVDADDVTIDLNGFALAGSGIDSGYGIDQGAGLRNLRVYGGKLVGWGGGAGMRAAGQNSHFQDLQVSSNRHGILLEGSGVRVSRCSVNYNEFHGIAGLDGANISECTASYNGSTGISVSDGVTITGCTSHHNGGRGISCRHGVSISDCAAHSNQTDGIYGSINATISRCAAFKNVGDGIFSGSGSTVSECTAGYNTECGIYLGRNSTIVDCAASFNTGDGIKMIDRCMAVNNTCAYNGFNGDGAGIHVTGTDNRIEGNHVTQNDRGIDVDAAGNLIIRNSGGSNGNGGVSNYVFTGTQTFGPTNQVSGEISTSNPWANFQF